MKNASFCKNIVLAGVVALTSLACSADTDIARVYVSTKDKGVKAYRVDDSYGWTSEGVVIAPNDGHTVAPVSCIHGQGVFYVLDAGSSTASFSIHRYDESFNYLDTPINACEPGSSSTDVQQMALSPDGRNLYVTFFNGNVLYRISTSDWAVSAFVTGSGINNSRGLCVSSDGTVFVANRGTNYAAGYDSSSGARMKMYSLSQASGVYCDDDAGLVYVVNTSTTLQRYKRDGSGGTSLTDSKLGNAMAITRVGERISVGIFNGHVITYDPGTDAFSYSLQSIGNICHLAAEPAECVSVKFADGTFARYGSWSAAASGIQGKSVTSVSIMPKTLSDGVLEIENPVLSEGRLAKGARFNRDLSEAEKSAYLTPGLDVRPVADAAGVAYEATDSKLNACVYASVLTGVRRYLVDADGKWTGGEIVLAAGDGHLVQPCAVVRIGRYFHVLDRGTTTSFSIHRYGLDFSYVDTPVSQCAVTSPEVQQMAASPDGAWLYVSCFSGGSLLRVNTSDWTVASLATAGINNSFGISVSRSGKIYVANRGTNYAAAYDPINGSRGTMHQLSQACGVLVDDKSQRVYVSNSSTTLKVFNVSDASGVGGVEYSTSGIQNSVAIARVGDLIYIANRSGTLSAFDPANGTFDAVMTGVGNVNHLYCDAPYVAIVESGNGEKAYLSFADAINAVALSSGVSMTVLPDIPGRMIVRFSSMNVVSSGSAKGFGVGTHVNRSLSVPERAIYLEDGLCVSDSDAGYVVSMPGDAARVYVSMPDYGVRTYVVDDLGRWTQEGDFILNSETGCKRVVSCVRIGRYFYLLDKGAATYPGAFSIWRYSEKGRCRGKLVDSYSENGVEPWQMAASPDGAYLYVSCTAGGALLRVEVATGVVARFATSSVNDSRGLCVGSDGTIYVAQKGQSAVRTYNPDTGAVVGYYPLSSASGVWYDGENKRLYMSNTGTGFKRFDIGAGDSVGTAWDDSTLSQSFALVGLCGYVFSGTWNGSIVSFEPETCVFTKVITSVGHYVNHLFVEKLPAPVYPPEGLSVIVK